MKFTAKNKSVEYNYVFTCIEEDFSFKYLGIPMYHKIPRSFEWKSSEDNVEKKLRRKNASYGAILIFV